MISRPILLSVEGGHPSFILIPFISVFDAAVADHSLILVLLIIYPFRDHVLVPVGTVVQVLVPTVSIVHVLVPKGTVVQLLP